MVLQANDLSLWDRSLGCSMCRKWLQWSMGTQLTVVTVVEAVCRRLKLDTHTGSAELGP